MYCPHCGIRLTDVAARCPKCDLNIQLIAELLGYERAAPAPQRETVAPERRWKQQRHALGLLLVMCSLLVGCFIPISIGLFSGFSRLGSLIVLLAGVAGLLLMLGAMLILASEGGILVSNAAQQSQQAEPSLPLLTHDGYEQPLRPDRPASRPAHR